MKSKASSRLVRHLRVRKRVIGTPERPRLCLSRSHRHLQAQLVDDFAQKTLFGFSTAAEKVRKECGLKQAGDVKAASLFGKFIAQKAKEKGIQKVVFDRAGYLYHGRLKAFADAARKEGLVF